MTEYAVNGVTGEVIEITEEDRAMLRQLAENFAAEELILLEQRVRAERDKRLQESDWIEFRRANMAAELLQAWDEYRQLLRDVPEQEGFPQTIEWPSSPNT